MRRWLSQHRAAFGRALRRLFAAPLNTLLSLIAIGIALTLPAFGYVALDSLRDLGRDASAVQQVSVFMEVGASKAEVAEIEQRLRAQPGVRTTFVPRDEALRRLKENGDMAEIVASLPRNPLPDAFIVEPRDTSPETLEALRAEFAAWPKVAHVQLDAAWIKRFDAFLRLGKLALLLLAGLFGAGLIAVTFNTIRLQVMAQAAEIEVARMIGATDAFIRRPFYYFGALQGAEVVEGTADEGVGGADHARHFDFRRLGHDLQADGVEGDGDQAGAEEAGEQQQGQLAEAQEGVEALDPGGVELDVGDLGPGCEFGAQGFQGFRRGVARFDDEGVGQRVARQAGDDLRHVAVFLEPAQGFVARHEGGADAGLSAQALLDLGDFGLAGADFHEDADLLHGAGVAAEVAQAVEGDVAESRQSQGDADGDQREQRVERRREEAAEGAPKGGAMLRQPASHTTLPWSRRSALSPQCSTQAWSWVATTTVTPTRWKSANRSRMSCADARSRLAVGSSASSTVGRLTTARAIARRCCSPPERAIGWAFSRASRPTLSSAAWARRTASRCGRPAICSGSSTLSRALRSKSSF